MLIRSTTCMICICNQCYTGYMLRVGWFQFCSMSGGSLRSWLRIAIRPAPLRQWLPYTALYGCLNDRAREKLTHPFRVVVTVVSPALVIPAGGALATSRTMPGRSINSQVDRTRLSPATAKCPSQSILPDTSSFLLPPSFLPSF
jgi:hypothetical protein